MKINQIQLDNADSITIVFQGMPQNKGVEIILVNREVFIYRDGELIYKNPIDPPQEVQWEAPQWTPGLAEQAESRADRKDTLDDLDDVPASKIRPWYRRFIGSSG